MSQQAVNVDSFKNKTTPVPSYAWVILGVVYLAGVAAPLNQNKVPPLMPVLMETFKIDLTMAGLLSSVFSVTGFLLAIPAGLIFQKLGPKVTGLIALGCLILGTAMGALSNTAGLLLTSRVIEGVGMGLIAVAAPAVIAAWFPAESRGTPMGIWSTWVPVGGILMYNMAPMMSAAFGWQSVWWFGAVFTLVAFALYGALVRLPAAPVGMEEAGEAPTMGEGLSNGQIWLLSAEFAFFNFVFVTLCTFLPTFLVAERGYDLASAAFVASLVMITTLVSCPLSGWLSDRIGSRKWVFTIPFIIMAVMLLFPFTVTGWMIPAYMILMGVLAGAVPTATFAAVPELMRKPQLVGIGMAIVAVGQNLGMFIGPVVFGKMVEATGWVTSGYLLIPAALVGLIAAWLIKIR